VHVLSLAHPDELLNELGTTFYRVTVEYQAELP